MNTEIKLTSEEAKVFELTKEYSSKHDWVHVMSVPHIVDVVKSLYEKEAYSNTAKSFLTRYFNKSSKKREKVNFGQSFYAGNLDKLQHKSPSEINNFLEDEAYYSVQKSNVVFRDIFKEHSDIITLKNKIKYLSKDMSYLQDMDFSDDTAIEMKPLLKKEIESNYPDTYIFAHVLKDLTIEALEHFSDKDWENIVLESNGITNHLGFVENRFEAFFYNSGHFETTFMAKKIFDIKFEKKPYLLMPNSNYSKLLDLFIAGEIKPSKSVVLVSNVISFEEISDNDLIKLKQNNYIPYPLSKRQVELYGREEYILRLMVASTYCSSALYDNYFYPNALKQLKYLLNFEELISLMKLLEDYSSSELFNAAGKYPEGLISPDGKIDFQNSLDLRELNEAY